MPVSDDANICNRLSLWSVSGARQTEGGQTFQQSAKRDRSAETHCALEILAAFGPIRQSWRGFSHATDRIPLEGIPRFFLKKRVRPASTDATHNLANCNDQPRESGSTRLVCLPRLAGAPVSRAFLASISPDSSPGGSGERSTCLSYRA